MDPFSTRYDIVIAGARCAGAATALLLARAGAKVLVVERQARGTDTMSTHALMRAGVMQLHRWGITPALASMDTPEITSTTFHYGPESIRVAIKAEHGIDHLCAPRRSIIDRILVEAAEAAGADIRHGVSLSGLQFDSTGRVIGAWLSSKENCHVGVGAGIVIGADGRQSMVARLTAAATYLESRYSTAYVYGYFARMPDDGLHWYFQSDAAAGTIPTNHAQHCVFASVPQHLFASTFRGDVERGFANVLAECSPELAETVQRADRAGRLRGFAGAKGFLRQPYGPGWALVGDAGYFKDPITAHGMTDALRDAELLARAVIANDDHAMEAYHQERDVLSIPLFEATDAIASFDWTLDEVKSFHGHLSAAMKAETRAVAQLDERESNRPTTMESDMNKQDTPWLNTISGRPEIGATAERTRQTSMRDVELFTEMTGDRNPIHYDAELAQKSPFGGLIVQGGVTTGLLNAVVAEELPGPGSVFLETNWKFVKAVQVGETIYATVKVEHVREDKPICRLETVVRNAKGETCVIGTATTYTMPLKPDGSGHAQAKAA